MTYKKLVSALACGVCIVAMATPASAQTRTYNIPAGSLKSALDAYGRQAGRPIIYKADQIRGLRSRGASGVLSPDAALDAILAGTPFRAQPDSSGAVAIVSTGTVANRSGEANAGSAAANDESAEIVVTAQKREERLKDVPVPVSVVRAESLVNSNQLQLQDYYTRVPGLSLTSQGYRNAPVIAIRGVTTGEFTNPVVGIVVDDLPYGASTNLGGGTLAPDIDPSELSRIEVLRGPQGTLYGASSMGGLLKYVTVDPSTERFSGRIQAGVNSLRGSVNLPLDDRLAVRASGFVRQDAGYIDDPSHSLDGVNRGTASGGRVSALWQPSPDISLKLGALLQNSHVRGSAFIDVQPGLGDLQQIALPDSGWSKKQSQVYSGTLNANFGSVTLTAVTGYSVNRFRDVLDLSDLFGTAASRTEDNRTTKFTQEVRLSGSVGPSIDWLIGGFYNFEKSAYRQATFLNNAATGASTSQLSSANFPSTFKEYAGFADVTFHLSDRFDVQIGARQSGNRQTYQHTLIFNGGSLVNPRTITKDHPFTYLLTPRFKLSDDVMVYARLASGYRPGAFNLFGSLNGFPAANKADKTQNYEVGIKGDFFDHALSIDASVYYIDWKDIQVSIIDFATQSERYVNGSGAKSQGIELSFQAKPLNGLSITGYAAVNDAKLTRSLPAGSPVAGVSGDRLPFSSRFSGNLSIDQSFPISAEIEGFIGGSVSYVSDRKGVFVAAPPRATLPEYAKFDLLAGARSGGWTANLFVNNVTDKRGVLSGGAGTAFPNSFIYVQPRTFGISIAKAF
jgi:iron complex outermembrane receptor protein